jgi:hypothetical protein|tara:strand:- start:1981 stop:2160 length:180 start_codon:yes stop_codon:yes gene_type:complete
MKEHRISLRVTWEQYVYSMLTTWEHLKPEGKRIAMKGMLAMAQKLDEYEAGRGEEHGRD